MKILVVNCGSSSLKFQLIATDLERIKQHKDDRLCRGEIEGIGGEANIRLGFRGQPSQSHTTLLKDTAAAVEYVVNSIISDQSGVGGVSNLSDINAVGHRVVHGGEKFKASVLIDEQVLKGIEECGDLAPLHNPDNLAGIRAARQLFGEHCPQVAVFDTAFHQSLPEEAYLYAIPYDFYSRYGVRRYGFHGTSHRYVASRYRALQGVTREQTNIITLHLGNGCSAAAIRKGRSVDTSMGMTPLEGLVMGTRCGDIDPAVVNFIAEKEKITTAEVETLLNKKSGLLGISGRTNDMRELQAALTEQDDQRARLAIEIFCYRARKYIGGYLAAMGRSDGVIFTGGIGENSPDVRARICDGMEWAGLRIDGARNQKAVGCEEKISTDGSALQAYVIPTDEELLIARDTLRVIMGAPMDDQ